MKMTRSKMKIKMMMIGGRRRMVLVAVVLVWAQTLLFVTVQVYANVLLFVIAPLRLKPPVLLVTFVVVWARTQTTRMVIMKMMQMMAREYQTFVVVQAPTVPVMLAPVLQKALT
jgi:hypothetical protein